MRRRTLLKAAVLGRLAARLHAAPHELREQAIWTAGEGGYHTYRIPALLVSKSGTLLAFCEGRMDDSRDHGNIDLLIKRSTDSGRTWSGQRIVYEEGGSEKVTIGNPCPVVDQGSGAIWLPFCRDNKDVFVTRSTDDGQSWSEPVNITSSVSKPDWTWYATGPGIGIQISKGPHKGRMVIPCDHRETYRGQPAKMSHAFYSDDRGKTWKLGGTVAPHTDECQAVERSDGSLLMNMRNYWERDGKEPDKGGKRAHSTSSDGGSTWSPLEFKDVLVEPVCQASIIRLSSKGRGAKQFLFSNPATRDKRIRMTVRMSPDEGQTWPVERLVFEGPSAYSSLAVLRNGNIGLLYERGRERAYETITFASFSLAWLSNKETK